MESKTKPTHFISSGGYIKYLSHTAGWPMFVILMILYFLKSGCSQQGLYFGF